jgi:predicted glycosyltransferase
LKKILFLSGSIGLGHIARDLAIAKELRSTIPNIEIQWIAYEPALSVLIKAGEKTVPEVNLYSNENIQAEATSKGPLLSLQMYVLNLWVIGFKNTNVVKKVLKIVILT